MVFWTASKFFTVDNKSVYWPSIIPSNKPLAYYQHNLYDGKKNRTKHGSNWREDKIRIGAEKVLRSFWARFGWYDGTKWIIQDKLSYAEMTNNTSAALA